MPSNLLAGKFVFGQKIIRPLFLVAVRKISISCDGQFFFRAEQRQHVEIIFNRVPGVILRQRAGSPAAGRAS